MSKGAKKQMEWLDEQMNGWAHWKLNGQTYSQPIHNEIKSTDEWLDGRMDRWRNGWMNHKGMDTWKDGRINIFMNDW